MSMRTWIDADTGEEIIFFIRRKRPFLFLRDRETKRWIAKLEAMEIRMYLVVEYPIEVAEKKNPVYCDAETKTSITPEDIDKADRIETWLMDRCIGAIRVYFNRGVAGLATVSGVEYGSKIDKSSLYPHNYGFTLVWKHHKGDEPRSEKGYWKW